MTAYIHLPLLTALVSDWTMKCLAIIVALVGIALKYWINRRRFYRRNAMGVEGFRSYESMRLITLLEGLGKLIGNIFIIVGILVFLLFWINNRGHHPSH